jgi:hypothetical protein
MVETTKEVDERISGCFGGEFERERECRLRDFACVSALRGVLSVVNCGITVMDKLLMGV